MVTIDRRGFMAMAGGAAVASSLALPTLSLAAEPELTPMTSSVVPIGRAEREARIAKAQRLMQQQGISAVLIEPGASLVYFTGVRWSRSERLTGAVIPAEGPIGVFTPFFEEPSVRESLAVPADLRTWNEHDDPLRLIAGWLKERKLGAGTIGVEETVRYFAVDGLQRALPGARIRSAASVVRPIRMIKSPAELALMQKAADVTLAAYRYTASRIKAGMTPAEIGAIMNGATSRLGGRPEFALVLLGEASAYPHGTGKPQQVREGEVVLMDCGCTVEGYQSDISRTFVFGEPTKRQRDVWAHMRQGQQIAFEAAKPGVPAGSVDDAVRKYYGTLGYGPDYKLPGLSHRTGHGIGLEGHEPVNLVRGETTRLAPGMCFSDEPGIYIPGQFGIRLEDCFYMTPSGPRWFSTPPPSLDRPFG
jgi:Xaa-Pro dipeptidase